MLLRAAALVVALALSPAGGLSRAGSDGRRRPQAQLFAAARAGNAAAVQAIAGSSNTNATGVDSRGFGLLSHVVQGWQSRMEAFPRPGWNSTAHSRLLRHLTEHGVGGASAGALVLPGCPVVDALHLRLLPAAREIQRVMPAEAFASCVTQRNGWGQTALHAVASAKATGLTRLLLRLRGQPDPSGALEAAIGINVSAATAEGGRPGALRFASIAGAVSDQDVKWLLDAARAAGVDMQAWVAQKDGLNRTAAAIACAEGRFGVGRALASTQRPGSNEAGAVAADCATAASSVGFDGALVAAVACGEEAEGRCASGAPGGGVGSSLLPPDAETAPGATPGDLLSLLDGDCAAEDDCTGRRGWAGHNRSLVGEAAEAVGRLGAARPVTVIARSSWTPEGADRAARACLFGAGTPCVLRGAGLWAGREPTGRIRRRSVPREPDSSPPGRPLVARRGLASRGGRQRVSVSELPYGRTYGAAAVESDTLAGFLDRRMGPGADTGGGVHPLYAFQALPPGAAERLVPLPRLPASLKSHIVELIAGAAGSGSMPHFHGPALNALLVGTKLWVVTQPSCASFATVHAVPWLTGLEPEAGCAPWVLLQRAGDVVTVPRHFGHVVVNLADALAVAFEQP